MHKIICLLLIIFLSSCYSPPSCDPLSVWVGDYEIVWIEGSYISGWLSSKVNASGQNYLTSGVTFSAPSWRIAFQSDNTWYSAISATANIGLYTTTNFLVSFEGTYEVFDDAYELRINDVTTNVGRLEVSEIIEFVESQSTGSWIYWTGDCSNSLRRFGRFEVSD